jgi:phosphatidylserine/phosphatidylglycerophosphate/cardiolipin synthase-like enzyme
MATFTAARAYCNNEVAFVAWQTDAKIDGCLGFEVTRVYLDDAGLPRKKADGTDDRVKTAAYVTFKGQGNPEWIPQDTGVWPVQKFSWRDLTLRKRRDRAERRPDEVRVRYEIRAVGNLKPGRPALPDNGRQTITDATGQTRPAYQGKPRRLGYLGDPVTTNPILITSRRGAFRSTFTNGILAAQWLSRVLLEDGKIQKGELLAKLSNPDDKHRRYLAGAVLPLLHELFSRPGSFHLALYELEDAELQALLLANGGRIHVILSNSSKGQTGWDQRNSAARQALADAGIDAQPRMFNNSVDIGHNKFVVHVAEDGTPRAVFTGSTNWTSTGVAGQTNNALLIEDAAVAAHFLDYWNRMSTDVLPVPDPLSAPMSKSRQGSEFRTHNRTPHTVMLDGGAQLTTWFSPNMAKRQRSSVHPEVPPDLAEVYRRMRLAEEAIFFLAFYPGQRGKDCIIGEAIDIGRKDRKLIVMGAVSSPEAMPNYVPKHAAAPGEGDDPDNPDDAGEDIPAESPATFTDGNVEVIRAARIDDRAIVGNFGREVLSAGRAIIHDKILVIDPFSADKCTVILGSHNLGFKASYANDENMVIVQGNTALAEAYMVHVLDVYDHYRFRAVQSDLQAQGKKPWDGFLSTNDRWQKRYLSGQAGAAGRYLATRP